MENFLNHFPFLCGLCCLIEFRPQPLLTSSLVDMTENSIKVVEKGNKKAEHNPKYEGCVLAPKLIPIRGLVKFVPAFALINSQHSQDNA